MQNGELWLRCQHALEKHLDLEGDRQGCFDSKRSNLTASCLEKL